MTTFLQERKDDVYFIELKKDLNIKGLNFPKEVPLPILFQDIKKVVKEKKEEFTQRDLIFGILFLFGIEADLAHMALYEKTLYAIDPDILLPLFNEVLQDTTIDEDQRLILLLGIHKLSPNNPEFLGAAARKAYERYTETEEEAYNQLAKSLFVKMAREHEDIAMPYYYLGFYYYNKNQFSKAKKSWAKGLGIGFPEQIKLELLELIPGLEGKIVYEEGTNLILNGRVSEGLEKLLSIRDDFTDWWNLMFFIGLGYRFLEEYDKALYYLERARQLNETDVNILNEIGICHTMMNQNDEAIAVYTNAAELAPDNHEIVCNIGIAFYNKGDLDQAKRFIHKAYEMNPEDEVTVRWVEHLTSL